MTFLEGKISTAEGAMKTKLETTYNEAVDNLAKAIQILGQAKPQVTSSVNYTKTQQIKAIENALNGVPTFTGVDIHETQSFCDHLSQIFSIMVTDVDPSLEPEFIKIVKLKLTQSVFKQMNQTKADVTTFDKFKQYVQSNFAPKHNAIQVMSKIFDVEFDEKAKFSVYAAAINEQLRTGYAAVNRQYKAVNKTTDNIPGEELSYFFGGVLLANHLKSTHFGIFRDLIPDLDQCMNATQIANRGEYYFDRLGNRNSSVFFGRSTNKNVKTAHKYPDRGGAPSPPFAQTDRHNKDRHNDDRHNDDRRNNDRQNDDRRNNDRRSNDRRTMDRRDNDRHDNDRRKNNRRHNQHRPNADKKQRDDKHDDGKGDHVQPPKPTNAYPVADVAGNNHGTGNTFLAGDQDVECSIFQGTHFR